MATPLENKVKQKEKNRRKSRQNMKKMDITKNGDLNLELVLESPLVCALFVLVCLEFFSLPVRRCEKKLLENWHNRARIDRCVAQRG